MRNYTLTAALLAAALVAVPSAQGQPKAKKKDTANKRVATAQDYVQLGQVKDVTGNLTTFDGKVLSVRVEYQTLELKAPKGGKGGQPKKGQNEQAAREMQRELREQQQMMREYQEIMRLKNPAERARRLQNLQARAMRDEMQDFYRLMQQQGKQNPNFLNKADSPYKVVTASVEFELAVADGVKVARAQLGIEYDDKGNVVQHTAEELKKLRDPVLPGYKAKLEDVLPGIKAKLYLGKARTPNKNTAPAKVDPKAAETKEAAEKQADQPKPAPKAVADDLPLPTDGRPQVQAILILSEPDASFLPKQPKRKKN